MDPYSQALLVDIFNHIDIFLVIIARLVGFFMLMPIFSSSNIPRNAKIAIMIFVAYILLTSGAVKQITYNNSLFGLSFLVVQEFITGLLIGFSVYLAWSAVYFAGQLMDFQIGFSMVSMFDPVSQMQVPIVGNLYYLALSCILVESGGLNSFIASISYSYKMLQPGQAFILGNSNIAFFIIHLISQFIVLGVSIALPIAASILLIDISLGLLVKAVPQMNVFVVGMPIKLLIGLVILYLIIPYLAEIYNALYQNSYRAILNMIGALATKSTEPISQIGQ